MIPANDLAIGNWVYDGERTQFPMFEEWKDICGFENVYKVSNLGRVKRVVDTWGRPIERILRPYLSPNGYYLVDLRFGAKKKKILVHRLVAIAFLDNPYKKPNIDHLNTIRTDNRVENLKWCTQKENCNNPISLKNLSESQKGEKSVLYGKVGSLHYKSKRVAMCDMQGVTIKEFEAIAEAERETGISREAICCVCQGKRKTAKGYKWRYVI